MRKIIFCLGIETLTWPCLRFRRTIYIHYSIKYFLVKKYFIFRAFDTDGDGKISKDEFRICMLNFGERFGDEQIAEMMQQADSDNDGSIDFLEFVQVKIFAASEKYFLLSRVGADADPRDGHPLRGPEEVQQEEHVEQRQLDFGQHHVLALNILQF